MAEIQEFPLLGTLEAVKNNKDINFEQLLSVRQSLEKDLMGWGDINDAVDKLEAQYETGTVLSTTMQRVRKETDYLKECDEAEITPMITRGFEDTYLSKIKAEFRYREKRGLEPNADFRINPRVITVRSYSDNRAKNLLRSMAKTGFFDETTEGLVHEATHAFQSLHFTNLQKIVLALYPGKFLEHEELGEAQATRSGYREDVQTRVDLIGRINDSLGIKPGSENRNKGKIIYSVIAVDQLKAMGLGLEEIGSLITNAGKWDERSGIYPKTQQIIEDKKVELNLDENGLENLVLAYRLEKDIQRLRAKRIAQEELKKAVTHLKKKK